MRRRPRGSGVNAAARAHSEAPRPLPHGPWEQIRHVPPSSENEIRKKNPSPSGAENRVKSLKTTAEEWVRNEGKRGKERGKAMWRNCGRSATAADSPRLARRSSLPAPRVKSFTPIYSLRVFYRRFGAVPGVFRRRGGKGGSACGKCGAAVAVSREPRGRDFRRWHRPLPPSPDRRRLRDPQKPPKNPPNLPTKKTNQKTKLSRQLFS